MKIVIAGAGSVGRSVALELLAHGHDITLIDNMPEKLRISSVADADWVLADACSPDALRDAGVAEALSLIHIWHSRAHGLPHRAPSGARRQRARSRRGRRTLRRERVPRQSARGSRQSPHVAPQMCIRDRPSPIQRAQTTMTTPAKHDHY